MSEIVNQQNVGLNTREMSTSGVFSDEKASRATCVPGVSAKGPERQVSSLCNRTDCAAAEGGGC